MSVKLESATGLAKQDLIGAGDGGRREGGKGGEGGREGRKSGR